MSAAVIIVSLAPKPGYCPHCAGVTLIAVPCDHDECMRRTAHTHDERCEACSGQGEGFDCVGCGAFGLTPICDECITWASVA